MARATVTLEGNPLGDAILSRVEIRQRLNDHWFCEIECRSTLDQPIPAESALGAPCVVSLLDEDGAEHLAFRGTFIRVALRQQIEGWFTCVLQAASPSWFLDRSPVNAHFSASPGDVAGQLGSSWGLPEQPSREYVQFAETNWTFLLRLADDNGGWICAGLNGVEVRNSFEAAVPLVLRDHYGLLEFWIDGELRPAKVAAAQYDSVANLSSVLPGESKQPQWEEQGQAMAGAVAGGSAQQNLLGFASRSRSATNADMQQRAQSEGERAQGGAVTGGGTSRAVTLQAGGSVAISNLEGANGTWYLTEVTHHWTPREYENSFIATPWKQWRSPRPPRVGIAPGVQVARVVSNVDPEQRGRLVVSLFWQEDTLLLAPMNTLHSGAGFGFAVLPEVGDEVLVAFQDADPERPVILGSLWNGKHMPPRDQFLTADEQQNNLVKRFVTKSGIRIHLTDTPGKESIVLATPSSNVLQLTEHAEETGRPAIHLHSEGDILIRAAGRIHTHAQFHSVHIDDHKPPLANVEFRRVYWDGTPIPNLPYTLTLADGTKQTGRTDGSGWAQETGVRAGSANVVYGDNKNKLTSSVKIAVHQDFSDFASLADSMPSSSSGDDEQEG